MLQNRPLSNSITLNFILCQQGGGNVITSADNNDFMLCHYLTADNNEFMLCHYESADSNEFYPTGNELYPTGNGHYPTGNELYPRLESKLLLAQCVLKYIYIVF